MVENVGVSEYNRKVSATWQKTGRRTETGEIPMKKVFSILWRNYNKATYNTLTGVSKGQYDIRLGASGKLLTLFGGLPTSNQTENGGYDISLPLEGYHFQGTPVADQNITVRYMGPDSVRKDWNISSQRPGTAYPMWIDPARMPGNVDTGSYVILIRTIDDKFYARVLLSAELPNTPAAFQKAVSESSDCGVYIPGVQVSDEAERIYHDLMHHTNLLMYGPPGTGKTTLMQEVVRIFNNGGISTLLFDEESETDYLRAFDTANSKTSWTTFHQSYSYEEFVIGMSTDSASKKLIDIRPTQGKLLELSEFARCDGNRALLVIDELNRANVSKVFGEFITVIEPDKRLDSKGGKTDKTVEIQLPYLKYGETLAFTTADGSYTVKNPFAMPKEVYTIASMNSIDKSIYPLDSALRRRFFRIDVYPEIRLLEKHYDITGTTYISETSSNISDHDPKMLKVLIKQFMNHMNQKIRIFLGRDYTLGFSYVWKLSAINDPEELMNTFSTSLYDQILPQLEEIFRNREEQMLYILGAEAKKESPYEISLPSEDESELGGTETSVVKRLDNITLVRWLERICGQGNI